MYEFFTLAAPPDGSEIADWVILVVGNITGAYLALRAARHFINDDYGGLTRMSVATVFVFGFVWGTDQMLSVMESLWDTVRSA
ncbi:hypothetical protein AB0918_18795 [Streptomyces sp. NPDC006864]|uniref:hypothetical protein n=1 Tax=Streptomyces sp. NPDC006864 TaxID=3154780 RepID=UPI003454C481